MYQKAIGRILGILALSGCSLTTGLNVVAEEGAPGRVTVSGISSGAYAAVQTHVALSSTISGAAAIAGGPYHCAEGNVMKALGRCISSNDLHVAPLIEATRAAASAGTIDHVASLADDRVWLFHSKADPVVSAAVTGALASFYAAFVSQEAIAFVDDIPVTHGWPTLDQGVACDVMGGDFINACDYDAAGALLQHLYGPLSPPVDAREDGLQVLDQASVVPEGGSFADSGFAYVPEACSDDASKCRLHISFHGCRQGKEFSEDRFARLSGLNEWAESNRIVVLYPQVNKSMMNPQGCWDWWGYTGADYDQRNGKQVAGVAALIVAWSK
jgi:poly(3-hydroxybutyrate) depolymerase